VGPDSLNVARLRLKDFVISDDLHIELASTALKDFSLLIV
jgi:hypothetical protein